MTKAVPNPETLREACQEVIGQNVKLKYIPRIFISETQNGYADNLPAVCEKLVASPTALQALEEAIQKYGPVLTLEDLILYSEHGGAWELSDDAREQAKATVDTLDKLFGSARWGTTTE